MSCICDPILHNFGGDFKMSLETVCGINIDVDSIMVFK